MEISTVALGARAIRARPTWPLMLTGVAVHASADIGWATLLFGAGGRRLARVGPGRLLALSVPWAITTSAIEYYLVLPWLQPLVPRQVPYWTGLTVHLTSGATYALYPWLARRGEPRRAVPGRHVPASRVAALALGAGVVALGALEALGRAGHEPPWPLASPAAREADRRFLHWMTHHHEVGVRLAQLAAERAVGEELRLLGRLMVAQQQADIAIMRGWWRSWESGEMPPLSPEERAAMPGMPHPAAVEALARLSGRAFEERFLALMIPHHRAAVLMADDEIRRGDPRLKVLADSIRQPHRSQIARMRAQPSAPAVTVGPRQLYQATVPGVD